MTKAAYDTINSGSAVDTARNALKFNGQFPAFYATATGLQTEADTRTSADDALSADITALQGTVGDHIADSDNPHFVSLEQARAESNEIDGDIDANGHTVTNLATPSATSDAATKGYVDGLIDKSLKQPEAFTPSGNYPTTYEGSAVEAGDTFRMTAAGTMGAVTVNGSDLLIALVDTPGQTDANWTVCESNLDQATESVKGVAQISTQAQVEDENSTNNTNIVTPQKLWLGLARFTQVAWTWALKQIFTTAPRFSSVTASQYLKVDASKDLTSVSGIPASDVTGTKTSSFISDFNTAALAAAPAETTTTIGTLIDGATAKTTPVDADMFGIMDSAASNILKKLSFANLRTWLLGYFVYEIARSGADSSSSNSTSEVVLDYFLIPAGTVTAGNVLEVKSCLAKTGTAGAMTHRLRIHTASSLGGTQIAINSPAAGIIWTFISRNIAVKANSGANSAYIYNTTSAAPTDEGNASAARTGLTVDWTVDNYILITGQLANAADSMWSSMYTAKHM